MLTEDSSLSAGRRKIEVVTIGVLGRIRSVNLT